MSTTSQQLLGMQSVKELTGLSRSGIYKYMAAGHFPKQYKMGLRKVCWKYEEVLSWREGLQRA